MKNYKHLVESLPSKTIVFAFGRFNPPTTGHELLVKAVKKLASMNKAEHIIYASRTQNSKKDPLPVNKKLHYLKILFPGINFIGANEEVRTFMEAAKQLNKKYKNLIMVAGSDRVSEYKSILDKYNGKEFNYNSIQVISAGERDPDSDNASGMSATKMRAAAAKGDFNTFKRGLPSHIRDIDSKLLMNDVRVGLGLDVIKEQIKFSVDETREKYFNGEIFKEGQLVESNNQKFTIIKRGTNHLLVEDENGMKFSKWIKDVYLVEDVLPGDVPDEITFGNYKTKNLHHSKEARQAFTLTIQRQGKAHPESILAALKATDTYMQINDAHLEQGKPPTQDEIDQWKVAHEIARLNLNKTGEFMHHEDYWHMHEHEIQDMLSTPPMEAEEYMQEELTTKTIKASDKLKVARMIASFLDVANAEDSSNANALVNLALRKIRTKPMHAESINMLSKMLKLATEVGIEWDKTLLPAKMKEEVSPRVVPIDVKSNSNAASDIMSRKDFLRSLRLNRGIKEEADNEEDIEDIRIMGPDGVIPDLHKLNHTKVGHVMEPSDDNLRRRKVKYRTEEVDHSDELDEGAGLWANIHAKRQRIKSGSGERMRKPGSEGAPNKREIENSRVREDADIAKDKMSATFKQYLKNEEVELDVLTLEDVYASDYKVNHETGRKSRAHRINFANSGAGSKLDSTPNPNEDKGEYKNSLNKEEIEFTNAEKKTKKSDVHVSDDSRQLGVSKGKGFDAFFNEEADDEDVTEQDLEKIVDDLSDDDYLDAYEDDELAIIDGDTGEEIHSTVKEEVEDLNEVLSRAERIKSKVRFARTKSKRERRVQIALKKHSDNKTINNRARRLAIVTMKKRLARKPLDKLTTAEKERIERIIQKRKTVINRLAMRMVPRVRKIETDRLSHSKYTKG